MRRLCATSLFIFCLSYNLAAQTGEDAGLLRAVKQNRMDSVLYFLERGASVNAVDSTGAPVLMWAALAADLPMVKFLVDKGADPHKKGIIRGDYLFGNLTGIAVARKDLPMLRYLVEEMGIDISDKELDAETLKENDWDALVYSLWVGDTSIIRYCVKGNTSLNPLELYLISMYFHMDLDSLLEQAVRKYRTGRIPDEIIGPLLELSIRNDDLKMLEKCLGLNQKLDKLDKDSLNPLSRAILLNHPEQAMKLIHAGADVNRPCYDGKTALYFAIEINDTVLAGKLISAGADINHQDHFGRSPLYFSIVAEKADMALFLLKKGADPSINTKKEDTPLALAMDFQLTRVVEAIQKRTGLTASFKREVIPTLIIPPCKSAFGSLQLSPDQKWLMARSEEKIYVWDVERRKVVREYENLGGTNWITNGRILHCTRNGVVTAIGIHNDERLLKFPFNTIQRSCQLLTGNKLVFREDDLDTAMMRLMLGIKGRDNEKKYQVINLDNNRRMGTFDDVIGFSANGEKIIRAVDGKLIVTSCPSMLNDTTLLNNIQPKMFVNGLREAHISNNGQYLLLEFDTAEISQSNTTIHSLNRFPIYDTQKGEVVYTVFGDGILRRPWFSKDSKTMVIHYSSDQGNFMLLVLQKQQSGEFKETLKLKEITSFCVSKDEQRIFYTTTSGSILLLDLFNKEAVTFASGVVNRSVKLEFTKMDMMNVLSDPFSIKELSLAKGIIQSQQSMKFPFLRIDEMMFNNTWDKVVTTDTSKSESNFYILDIDKEDFSLKRLKIKGKVNMRYEIKSNGVVNYFIRSWVIAVPGGKGFLVSNYITLNLFAETGELISNSIPLKNYLINSISFSKEGDLIAVASGFEFFDTITGKIGFCSKGAWSVLSYPSLEPLISENTSKQIVSMCFSPNNEEVWISLNDGEPERLLVYSIRNRKYTDSRKLPGVVNRLDEVLLMGLRNTNKIKGESKEFMLPGCIVLFDTLTNKEVRRIKFDPYRGHPILSPNLKWMCYLDKGGAITFWDIEKDKELCSLYTMDSNDFVVTTPQGLFDASPGAMEKMSYVAGMEAIELSQLKQRYYQPGLLPILLGYRDEELRDVTPLSSVRLFPKVNLELRSDTLLIRLRNQGGGIGPVHVYIGDIEVLRDARPGLARDSSLFTSDITLDLKIFQRYFLPGKSNDVRVVAWNEENYLSSQPFTVQYTPATFHYTTGPDGEERRKPRVFGLFIGTSDYEGASLDLRYAARDAEDLRDALNLAARRLFGQDRVDMRLLCTTYPGALPSRKNILEQAAFLENAGPEDIVIVYLSGHGTFLGGQDGQFYYLTREASDISSPQLVDPALRQSCTLSGEEIKNLLNRSPARKKVLILDACSSGKAVDNLMFSVKELPSSQKRMLEFTQEATGCHLLASSTREAPSYESTGLGHGLLTYSLLQAIKGGKLQKVEKDEFVDVSSLLSYAQQEVPQLASNIAGIQEPVYRSNGRTFQIGQMTREDKKKIPLAEPGVRILSSRFSNRDLTGKELDLEDRVDSRIEQLSLSQEDLHIQLMRIGDYPGAYRIDGFYQVGSGMVEVDFVLKKDGQAVGPERHLRKPSEKLDDLVNELVEAILPSLR